MPVMLATRNQLNIPAECATISREVGNNPTRFFFTIIDFQLFAAEVALTVSLPPRSSKHRPGRIQQRLFHQEVFVGEVQRLVSFCRRIPRDPNRQHMLIGGTLDGREVQLDSLDSPLHWTFSRRHEP